MTKTIHLKIVGHDNSIDIPDNKGFRLMRLFSKEKGEYKITYNESGKPCLQKTYTNPSDEYCMSIVPHIEPKCVEAILGGKTLLIDNDIVAKK